MCLFFRFSADECCCVTKCKSEPSIKTTDPWNEVVLSELRHSDNEMGKVKLFLSNFYEDLEYYNCRVESRSFLKPLPTRLSRKLHFHSIWRPSYLIFDLLAFITITSSWPYPKISQKKVTLAKCLSNLRSSFCFLWCWNDKGVWNCVQGEFFVKVLKEHHPVN